MGANCKQTLGDSASVLSFVFKWGTNRNIPQRNNRGEQLFPELIF